MCYTTKPRSGSASRSRGGFRHTHKMRQSGKLTMSSLVRRAPEISFSILVVAFIGHKGRSLDETEASGMIDLSESMCHDALSSSDPGTNNLAALFAFFLGSALTASILLGEPSLPRLEKWFGDLFSSTKSAVSSVSSSTAMSRICSTVNASSIRLFHLTQRNGNDKKSRTLAISSPRDPFFSLDDTAMMTLSDVKELFRYSANMNGLQHALVCGIDVRMMRPTLQKAACALDSVSSASRGVLAAISSSNQSQSFGDVDALSFAAACRLFAEWRGVRLVPEGSAAYAIGMNVARRDLLQNVAKIEKSVHTYLAHYQDQGTPLQSPTLRQLLGFEIEKGMHRNRPRVQDKSGASGVLWTVRQLRYQTILFENVVQVPLTFPNAKAAANAAYHAVFDPYHGFFTRKIFTATFDSVPCAEIILNHMNLPAASLKCDETVETNQSSVEGDGDGDDTWIQLPIDSTEPVERNEIKVDEPLSERKETPLEQLGGHLVREWLKLHRFMAQCTGQDAQRHQSRNVMDLGSSLRLGSKHGANEQVQDFVSFMQPFLEELDAMIKEINLNDPTRV